DNKNYIVSTEAICDTVWGIDSFGYEKSLMVHIRNIREKIELNPTILFYIRQ
ncbi:TPA: helix-turn-helix domain-containing protein, partial [Streptococcus suis]